MTLPYMDRDSEVLLRAAFPVSEESAVRFFRCARKAGFVVASDLPATQRTITFATLAAGSPVTSRGSYLGTEHWRKYTEESNAAEALASKVFNTLVTPKRITRLGAVGRAAISRAPSWEELHEAGLEVVTRDVAGLAELPEHLRVGTGKYEKDRKPANNMAISAGSVIALAGMPDLLSRIPNFGDKAQGLMISTAELIKRDIKAYNAPTLGI